MGALSLSLPADWVFVDLSSSPMAAVRQMAQELQGRPAGQDQDQDPARRDRDIHTRGALQQAVRQAQRQGAVLAAVWSDMDRNRIVSASALAAVRPVGSSLVNESTARVDLAAAAARLSETSVAPDGARADLPVGPAIRVRQSRSVEIYAERHQTEVVQYFAAVPGRAAVVELTFSTPNIDLLDLLGELFEAIARTTRWRP